MLKNKKILPILVLVIIIVGVIMLAIKGMLPKNSLGRQMLKKVRVYAGNEHENIAQKPEVWNF